MNLRPSEGCNSPPVRASEITDAMIGVASMALAGALTGQELEDRCLMPEISRLWEVCGIVAHAVAQQAIDDGVAVPVTTAELTRRIDEIRWRPEYPKITCTR